jgi:hypothetical protein
VTRIRLEDLDPSRHTSFSFYDFLPGQGFEVDGAPAAGAAVDAASRLLQSDLLDTPDEELDNFAALLLTHGAHLVATDPLQELARSTARAFAELLGDEAQRPRRMRLTRLSLMLRVILDRDADTSGVTSEFVLPGKSPWDWVADAASGLDGWAVTCNQDNLRRLRFGQVDFSLRCGLPTQLDPLPEGLWVGSHYASGGHIVRGLDDPEPEVTHIAHHSPLVLAFDSQGQRWVLDAAGALWRMQGTRVAGKELQLPGKVHRARSFGGTLYAFDWGRVGACMQVDLQSLQVRTVPTGDIIVCNDVCAHAGMLYGICKLQGRVFKMTPDWTPLQSKLGAGLGAGRLLDPIMIRSAGGRLSVLNWFSAKLLQLDAF